MAASRQQYMPVAKEIEVIAINASTRRICTCPKEVPKLGELHISAPQFVFGPFHQDEPESSASAKDEAWKKILEKERKDEKKINEIYLSAMRTIEKEARAAYGDAALSQNDLTESKFRWKMIKDGCFFLQLTLSILGAAKKLDYPDDHLIFGKKQSKKTFQGLIRSIFLLGNQIPLVVLNELMKQNFFQIVIGGVQWERPSDMLSKQILYEYLVIPALEHSNNHQTSTTLPKLTKRTYLTHQGQPSDLLHGLQLFLLGPGKSSARPSENEGEDELEDGDLEAGIRLKSKSEARGSSNEDKKKEEFGNKDDKSQELCASNLKNKGIYIWKTSGGSRGIHFRNWILWGSLFLPTLKVNHDTIVLYTNLKYYEIVHQQKEVRSYLNFLAQLISTYEDLNVLTSQGIIDDSTTSDQKERFLEMLRTLADKETMTHRHHSVIGRVKDYSVFPWEKFKYVAIVVFFLTIAQTVFGVLSYVVGVKQLHQTSG